MSVSVFVVKELREARGAARARGGATGECTTSSVLCSIANSCVRYEKPNDLTTMLSPDMSLVCPTVGMCRHRLCHAIDQSSVRRLSTFTTDKEIGAPSTNRNAFLTSTDFFFPNVWIPLHYIGPLLCKPRHILCSTGAILSHFHVLVLVGSRKCNLCFCYVACNCQHAHIWQALLRKLPQRHL
jgi:hypothetical protein